VSSKQLAFRVRDLVGVATARILGRSTSGSGRAEELTASQVRTLLDVSATSEIAAAYQPIGSYAASSHTHAASDIVSGTITTDRLGSGTASSSTFLRGDQTWATVSAGVGGSTGSTDNRVLRADGTGGSTLQSSAVTIDDNGAIALPALSFSSRSITIGSNFGFAVNGGVQLWEHVNGSYVSAANDSQVSYRGGVHLTFASNNTFPLNGDDVGVIRHTTRTVRISDASTGFGDLTLRNLTTSGTTVLGPYTFATVPSASSNTGATIRVTDRSHRLATSDGTNWNWAGTTTAIS
jgi:hypothetical protein